MAEHTPFPWTIGEARTAEGMFVIVAGYGPNYRIIAEVATQADALLIVKLSKRAGQSA